MATMESDELLKNMLGLDDEDYETDLDKLALETLDVDCDTFGKIAELLLNHIKPVGNEGNQWQGFVHNERPIFLMKQKVKVKEEENK